MSSHEMNPHISPEDLTAYCAGDLYEDEEKEGYIEEHIAKCTDCTVQARQLYAIREKQLSAFATVWDRWTAAEHGRVHQLALMIQALDEATHSYPQWKERLQRWRDQWKGQTEGAVRVVMATAEQAGHILTEGLEALVRPGGRWQFTLPPSTLTLGAMRTRGEAKAAPQLVALAQGESRAHVAVSGTEEISVRVDDWPTNRASPLVLLIPITTQGQPQAKELHRASQGAAYLFACFEQVEPGEYLVALEPVDQG